MRKHTHSSLELNLNDKTIAKSVQKNKWGKIGSKVKGSEINK